MNVFLSKQWDSYQINPVSKTLHYSLNIWLIIYIYHTLNFLTKKKKPYFSKLPLNNTVIQTVSNCKGRISIVLIRYLYLISRIRGKKSTFPHPNLLSFLLTYNTLSIFFSSFFFLYNILGLLFEQLLKIFVKTLYPSVHCFNKYHLYLYNLKVLLHISVFQLKKMHQLTISFQIWQS